MIIDERILKQDLYPGAKFYYEVIIYLLIYRASKWQRVKS